MYADQFMKHVAPSVPLYCHASAVLFIFGRFLLLLLLACINSYFVGLHLFLTKIILRVFFVGDFDRDCKES